MSVNNNTNEVIVAIKDLKNFVGDQWLHRELCLTVQAGEIVAIIGSSGCGKTTLLRSILMLHPYTAGSIKVFGLEIACCSALEAQSIRRRWGVMFQNTALFSSLTLLENVMFPLRKLLCLSKAAAEELAYLKIVLSGLKTEDANKYPSELSGGMKKKAALARAIALDPALVFLDEPTSGLDPKAAAEIDTLIMNMRETLGVTFVMVTHDLDTLWQVTDRVIYLGEGKVLAAKKMEKMVQDKHPLIAGYFDNQRSRQCYSSYRNKV